jgi:predicted small secreted protein
MCKKPTQLVFILIALSGAVLLLGACHTISGAGQDVSQAGQAVEKSADRHAP